MKRIYISGPMTGMPDQGVSNVVYRIQDKDGLGPFKPGFSRHWVEPRDDHVLLVPWYSEFGPVHLRAIAGMHIGSGCRSKDQLCRWFSQTEYARLVEFGYQAVQMPVDRVLAESNIQCVFERINPLRIDVEPFALYAHAVVEEA